MAVTADFNLRFTDASQRIDALVDFCKAHELDIYSDTVSPPGESIILGTIVDPNKLLPAAQSYFRRRFKADVMSYRVTAAAGQAARDATTANDATLNP